MLKRIYYRYKEWLTLFSSAFVGTLLGIGLTFVLSGHVEQKEKEEVGHKFLQMTLDEIDKSIGQMDDMLTYLQYTDTLLNSSLYNYYPDKLDQFPDSLAKELFTALHNINILHEDDMTEQIFFNNIKTIEVFEDLSIVTDIRKLYVMTHSINNIKRQQDQIINDIEEACYEEKDPNLLSTQEIIHILFNDPKISRRIHYYHACTVTVQAIIKKLKEEYQKVRENPIMKSADLKKIQTKSEITVEFNS